MPVQRIARRCAYISMPVNFDSFTETVFIACPITFKILCVNYVQQYYISS